jgi:hypothetical protein
MSEAVAQRSHRICYNSKFEIISVAGWVPNLQLKPFQYWKFLVCLIPVAGSVFEAAFSPVVLQQLD